MANDSYNEIMQSLQSVNQAVSQVGSIALGGEMNNKAVNQAKKTREWMTAEREAAQEWNRQQWEDANEWNLNEWNREWDIKTNYESPAEVAKRYEAAGFSPLAALGGQSSPQLGDVASSPAAGASDPSASLPQIMNPAAGLNSMAIAQGESFLKWQQLQVEQDKAAAQIDNLHGDSGYKRSLTQTENAMRSGKLDFLGVQIDCGRSNIDLNDARVREIASSMSVNEAKVQQLIQWCRQSNADINYKSWRQYCESKKLPREIVLLGAQIFGLNASSEQAYESAETNRQMRPWSVARAKSDAYSAGYRAQQDADYYNSGQFRIDMVNRGKSLANGVDITHWQAKQMEGQTHSDEGYTYLRGVQQAKAFIDLFTGAAQGYMFQRIGVASMPKTMPVSSPNPASAIPTNDIYLP